MNAGPYLSVVLVGRNDDYGGDFLGRLRLCLSALAALGAGLTAGLELVIVDWNPPDDKESLRRVLSRWDLRHFARVLAVEVPHYVHRELPYSERMPMFEYVAKNVGIRRARGEWVLVMNPDIVLSSAMITFLSKEQLRRGHYYRANRHDVRVDTTEPPDFHEIEKSLFAHWERIHLPWGSYSRQDWTPWRRITGWMRRTARMAARRASAMETLAQRGCLNASGDFLLMARRDWYRIRGFPELYTHSHADSMACILALAHGLRPKLLRFPIFHVEHCRAAHAQRPPTPWDDVARLLSRVAQGARDPRELCSSDENWGMAGLQLPETVWAATHA